MTASIPQWPTDHPRFNGPNVPPLRTGRRRLHPAGDIATAIGLLVLDAVAALATFLFSIDHDGWKPFDPGADNSAVVLTPNWLYVGIVGGIILLTAPLLYLLRALISTGTQVLAGLVVAAIAVAGAQIDQGRAARSADTPTSARTAAAQPCEGSPGE